MKYLKFLLMALLLASMHGIAQEGLRADAMLLEVRGPIGPAISDFIERNIEKAGDQGSRVLILHLDTPGGLDTSMRAIIKAILASPVPVISYVAPSGSRAASAGTFILYASHVAAMAPATNLGAATPVSIGPGSFPGDNQRKRPAENDDAAEDGEQAPAAPASAMERKVINDAVAYIRGLAKLRGRNADWAEQAVRSGVSLTAEDALEQNVIDLMAANIEELLGKLDGRKVKVGEAELTLNTEGWNVVTVQPDWRTELLAVITNPNVAYMLMMLGIYGLLFELYSPGAVIPGIVGAISLLLALYAFHVLPVNYAGVALILVGIGLMVTELVTPTFGAVGVGGVVAFVIGSIILFDTDVEGFTVSMPLVITVGLVAAGLFSATILLAVRQRARPVVTGREEMIGAVAEAMESFSETGAVRAHGEVWSARSAQPVAAGQSVRINKVDGLTLEVEPLKEEK
jgi:membrane-bound serine protease (ClpP class)